MYTFDFDLPNITSIDRCTVLRFTCWEKHLLRPSWKPGHKPPLHYPGCRWQSCDDESSMVCWDLALITAVIYWQLLYPLTTAITSWVIMVHKTGNSSVCYLDIDVWTLQSYTLRSICSESSPLFPLHFFIEDQKLLLAGSFILLTDFNKNRHVILLLFFQTPIFGKASDNEEWRFE